MAYIMLLLEAGILALAAWLWFRRRQNALLANMVRLARAAEQDQAALQAQLGLDRNIDLLRAKLSKLGAPRLEGDRLFFGQTCVNGDVKIVDEVRTAHGGVATIFMRDQRVATNVVAENGQRAIGTNLARGAVYDAVFTAKASFRGEAEILGERYYTYYEPVLSGGAVIGVLFVGVKKNDVKSEIVDPQDFPAALSVLSQMNTVAKATTMEALTQRQNYEDVRRHDEDARRAKTEAQRVAMEVISTALGELARGNLGYRLTTRLDAAYETLRTDLNQAFEKLSTAMQAIGQTAGGVTNSAREIRQASDDLSRRTEQQAATLEQTAAALSEISGSIRTTFEDVKHTQMLAAGARNRVDQSGAVLVDATRAMQRIEEASGRIGEIIVVIDEIAFQTSLLALNAGVEAARAGEAGRGFAVVATEIRGLAQRSADASKEIKNLITNAGTQVEDGVKLVHGVAALMAEIVAEVQKIDQDVQGISGKTAQQSAGLAEISGAVNQMDQVTQQNAAMVEETTAVSHALEEQANDLTGMMEQFSLEDSAATRQDRIVKRLVQEVS
ncbi:methyl-accepting chemotaxis protein [Acidocella aminolytica]|uniref:Methyl-accepting chemotaxis sensory transducer n=1 Tax=Acidocella aminolytica 101 = DSM 11237 TaxID=1120923 RepID=A0A0D6PF45_9PROT|nr:methyl-accepting chemotaxis protein [Acidocella aminolytica]GAN79981.1 methyl-accepting chemotaxis sensory transducer [Acidocella aminolytica 101 = DSM 11237]SHE57748.1 Single cache domain 3-containing protein [Acidocella aminolytica 101 = DSM 11237]